MKKYIALISLLFFLMAIAVSCTNDGEIADNSISATSAEALNEAELKPIPEGSGVVSDDGKAIAEELDEPNDSGDAFISDTHEPKVVFITKPYFDGYELTERFDYNAFLEYLDGYFGKLIGEEVHRYVSFDRGETWEWDGRIT